MAADSIQTRSYTLYGNVVLALMTFLLFEVLYAAFIRERFESAWVSYDAGLMNALRPPLLICAALPAIVVRQGYRPAHLFVAMLFALVYVPILVVAPSFLGPARFLWVLVPTALGMSIVAWLSQFQLPLSYRGNHVLFWLILVTASMICVGVICYQATLTGLRMVSVLDVGKLRGETQVGRLVSYAQHIWTFALGPLWIAIALRRRAYWILLLALPPFFIAYATTFQVTMLYASFWCLAIYAATRVLGDLDYRRSLILAALPLAFVPIFPMWGSFVRAWHSNNLLVVAFGLAILLEYRWLLLPQGASAERFRTIAAPVTVLAAKEPRLALPRGISGLLLGLAVGALFLVVLQFQLVPKPELYGSYIGYRLYGVHGQIFAHYVDFFSSNPHTWFSHVTGVNWFIDYPYDQQLPLLIGSHYPGGNQNANFWTQDAVAGGGPWAIPFVSAVFGLLLIVINSSVQGLERSLIAVASCMEALRFADGTIPTALLTGGLGLLILLFVLAPRDLFGPTDSKRVRGPLGTGSAS